MTTAKKSSPLIFYDRFLSFSPSFSLSPPLSVHMYSVKGCEIFDGKGKPEERISDCNQALRAYNLYALIT